MAGTAGGGRGSARVVVLIRGGASRPPPTRAYGRGPTSLSPPQPESVTSSRWPKVGMVRVMDVGDYASMTESAMTAMETQLQQRMDQGFRQIVNCLDRRL